MKTLAASLLIGLATSACGFYWGYEPPNLKGTLRVDPEMPAEVIEEVIAATQQWHNATGGMVNLKVIVANRNGEDFSIRNAPLQEGSRSVELGRQLNGQIVIDLAATNRMMGEGAPTNLLRVTILHELGHAFGLNKSTGFTHAEPGHGLMQPDVRGVPACIDQETLDLFCERTPGCSPQSGLKSDCE